MNGTFSSNNALPLAASVANAKGWDGATRAIMLAGKHLPILPEHLRNEDTQVPGCESPVWLARIAADTASLEHLGEAYLAAYSPSKIIRGVLAVLLEKANTLTPSERENFDFQHYLKDHKLERHLSQSRSNGIAGVLARLSTL